jgi:hypothetical protein
LRKKGKKIDVILVCLKTNWDGIKALEAGKRRQIELGQSGRTSADRSSPASTNTSCTGAVHDDARRIVVVVVIVVEKAVSHLVLLLGNSLLVDGGLNGRGVLVVLVVGGHHVLHGSLVTVAGGGRCGEKRMSVQTGKMAVRMEGGEVAGKTGHRGR